MLADSRARIQESLAPDALVLDVGAWAHPLSRADWVIDLMPYETRGLYGEPDPEPERFTADTWVEWDICDRTPWPFDDASFDYAICSHTLEDVRDPVWVCSELNRVAKAGYIEVPARVEEQTKGIHGAWVGWSHHHWLVDVDPGRAAIQFVFKPHLLHEHPEFWVSLDWTLGLDAVDRVSRLFWDGSFSYRERIFFEPDELHRYLEETVEQAGEGARTPIAEGSRKRWLGKALRRPG